MNISQKVKDDVWRDYTKNKTSQKELKSIFMSSNPSSAYKKISDKIRKKLQKTSISDTKVKKSSPRKNLRPSKSSNKSLSSKSPKKSLSPKKSKSSKKSLSPKKEKSHKKSKKNSSKYTSITLIE